MNRVKAIIEGLFLLMAIAACREPVDYPVEPRISYEGFAYLMNADSTFSGKGVLSLSYTDGDGDLGLNASDSLYPFGNNDPYYYNLIVEYQKYENGTFHATPLVIWNNATQRYDTMSFNARFKRLLDTEEPKPISGHIDDTLFIQNPFSPNDTIRFAVRIIDRALHESNTIQTEAIYTNPSLK